MSRPISIRILLILSALCMGTLLGGCPGEPPPDETTAPTPTPTATPTSTPTPTPTPTLAPGERPTLAIVSPRGDGINPVDVALNGDLGLDVTVVSTNFTLKAPGTCTPEDGLCGHVRLNIDGDAGNQPGFSYNALGWVNLIPADFSVLADLSGRHTVTAALFYDDGEEVISEGSPVAFSVDVKVDASLSLSITLTQDQRLRLGNDDLRSVSVPFTLSNYTLKPPGACRGAARCGHIYVKINGEEGNAPGLQYNDLAWEAPAQARFGYVASPEGTHRLTLSLRDDNGAPVVNDGAPVEDTVQVITQSVSPQLTIITPTEGGQALLNEQNKVTIVFAAANYALAAPGTCPASALPDCGYVEVKVDGDAGDQAGKDYNSVAIQSPASADMDPLSTPGGYHTFTLRLMRDGGEPVVIRGEAVEAQITVLVVEAEDPILRFVNPTDGDDIVIGTDVRKTVPVSFAIANLRLAAPGTCGGAADCGHIHLLVDGPAGNAPGQPYNNIVTSGPSGIVDAYFDTLDEPTGAHRITMSLRDDSGAPFFLNGNPIEVSIQVNASIGVPTLDIIGLEDGQRVRLGEDPQMTVRVPFRAENFTVKPPGTCTGEEPNLCGYVEVSVNGVRTGDTGSNPAPAYFELVPEPIGTHTIALRLMTNEGDPLLVDSGQVRSTVEVVTQSALEPYARILTPIEGSLLTLNTDLYASPVSFSVVNFALTEPDAPCPPREDTLDVPCGYALLKIDGDAGDRFGLGYNNIAYSQAPILAYYDALSTIPGAHTLSFTLYEHGSVSPVALSGGLIAEDSVRLTVAIADDPIDLPDDPILVITRPQELGESPARATLTGAYGLEVDFFTENVTLRAPGQCSGVTGPCGHVRGQVDGDGGNQPGLSYNALSPESPIFLDLTQVADPSGTHNIRLFLVGDNGAPLLSEGSPIEASILVDIDISPDVTILLFDGSPLALDNTPARKALIPFQVANYDLKAPGTCAGEPRCGHIVVKVDDDSGDLPGQDYNGIAIANPALASFGALEDPEGLHSVTLSLRDDSGSPVQDGGRPVESTIIVETRSVNPAIAIATPFDGGQVRLSGADNLTVPLSLVPTRFLLREPGACTEIELPDCGYGVVKIDGDAGNQPGESYNALATSPVALADFGTLGTPTGNHRISITLKRNDGSPVLVDGAPVEDKVDVLVSLDEDPILRLLYPASYDLTEVPLGTDDALTVPISFLLSGYSLQEPGTCNGADLCGHIYVKIDGDEGDISPEPYNNIIVDGTLGFSEAYFVALSEPTGAHTLTLSLRTDDGSPYTLYGVPVEVSAFINTEYALPELNILGLSDGEHVRLAGDDADPFLAVAYQTRNFVQESPGGCSGDEFETCGYVEMYLDGEFKGVSDLNPAQVSFSGVSPLTGSHIIKLAMVSNEGEPVLVDGIPIEASVEVVVQDKTQPFIRIVSPREGGEVSLVGEGLTTFFTFLTDEFLPTSPGDICEPQGDGTIVTCGYIVLKIDGDAGNRPLREYNNIWYTPAPIPAFFGFLEDPRGSHVVTLTLYDHITQAPIVGPGGVVSQASVTVTTQLPPDAREQ